MIQIKASKRWISFVEGKKQEALRLMSEAADMEDATAKHPVTPGEIIPARELLAEMYYEMGDFSNAAEQYEADLITHPNRFNGLYGAFLSYQKLGDKAKAAVYHQKLVALTNSSKSNRPQMRSIHVASF